MERLATNPAQATPLFIVGCVRSGTTLVRNLLRRQPNIICPEETHYFRYGEPFRTNASTQTLMNGAVLKRHRMLDGITPEEFGELHRHSRTRAELMCRHVECMAKHRGLTEFKWFDKTPQNVYGIAMMNADFPKARFLHLIRNPLNVVASLKLGKVVNVPDIHGACNYWLEAVTIIKQMSPVLGNALLEMRYEDFTNNTRQSMEKLLEFSRLGDQMDLYSEEDTHPEQNHHTEILSDQERTVVKRRCGKLAEAYGYDLD